MPCAGFGKNTGARAGTAKEGDLRVRNLPLFVCGWLCLAVSLSEKAAGQRLQGGAQGTGCCAGRFLDSPDLAEEVLRRFAEDIEVHVAHEQAEQMSGTLFPVRGTPAPARKGLLPAAAGNPLEAVGVCWQISLSEESRKPASVNACVGKGPDKGALVDGAVVEVDDGVVPAADKAASRRAVLPAVFFGREPCRIKLCGIEQGIEPLKDKILILHGEIQSGKALRRQQLFRHLRSLGA